MGDLLMIVITVGALVLCHLYIRWCDRIATAELTADLESTRVMTSEEVTA